MSLSSFKILRFRVKILRHRALCVIVEFQNTSFMSYKILRHRAVCVIVEFRNTSFSSPKVLRFQVSRDLLPMFISLRCKRIGEGSEMRARKSKGKKGVLGVVFESTRRTDAPDGCVHAVGREESAQGASLLAR